MEESNESSMLKRQTEESSRTSSPTNRAKKKTRIRSERVQEGRRADHTRTPSRSNRKHNSQIAAERILGRVAGQRSEKKTIQATEEEQGTKIVILKLPFVTNSFNRQVRSLLEKKQHCRPPDKLPRTHIGGRDKSQ